MSESSQGLSGDGIRPAPVVSGVSEDEARIRRDLAAMVSDASFPATRNDLLRHIGPDSRGFVESRPRMLPPDVLFESPDQLLAAFGGMTTGN